MVSFLSASELSMNFANSKLTLKILSLRKHPFLLALRRWGRNVPSGEERGETDVFAG